MVDIQSPQQMADLRAWYEAQADEIMADYPEYAPDVLALDVAKAQNYEHGSDSQLQVAALLRSRQAEWLRGRRWPEGAGEHIPGKPDLTRTSEGAQPAPTDDA